MPSTVAGLFLVWLVRGVRECEFGPGLKLPRLAMLQTVDGAGLFGFGFIVAALLGTCVHALSPFLELASSAVVAGCSLPPIA